MSSCPYCEGGYREGGLIACASETEDCAWVPELKAEGDEHRVMRAALGLLWAEMHEQGSIESIGLPPRSAMRVSQAFGRLVTRYNVPRPESVPDSSPWARYGPHDPTAGPGPRLVQ